MFSNKKSQTNKENFNRFNWNYKLDRQTERHTYIHTHSLAYAYLNIDFVYGFFVLEFIDRTQVQIRLDQIKNKEKQEINI